MCTIEIIQDAENRGVQFSTDPLYSQYREEAKKGEKPHRFSLLKAHGQFFPCCHQQHASFSYKAEMNKTWVCIWICVRNGVFHTAGNVIMLENSDNCAKIPPKH